MAWWHSGGRWMSLEEAQDHLVVVMYMATRFIEDDVAQQAFAEVR